MGRKGVMDTPGGLSQSTRPDNTVFIQFQSTGTLHAEVQMPEPNELHPALTSPPL